MICFGPGNSTDRVWPLLVMVGANGFSLRACHVRASRRLPGYLLAQTMGLGELWVGWFTGESCLCMGACAVTFLCSRAGWRIFIQGCAWPASSWWFVRVHLWSAQGWSRPPKTGSWLELDLYFLGEGLAHGFGAGNPS